MSPKGARECCRRRFARPTPAACSPRWASPAALYAQLESGERGILPLDSSSTLEIGGIHVDVGGADAQSARYAGWRIAQRQGFKALWAKMHNAADRARRRTFPTATLDQIVSSINVEREQIGPNRYIADLGVLFDRARAAAFLGVAGGEVAALGADAADPGDGHGRNRDQRRAAQCLAAGLGAVPHLAEPDRLCPRQRHGRRTRCWSTPPRPTRPGRGWWRNLLDMYGAADILVAEVQLQRLYPGGPARARFIARHGPDNEIVGGFTLTAAEQRRHSGDDGRRARSGWTSFIAQALAAGRLTRDSSLNLPPPPVMPELPRSQARRRSTQFNAIQVQVSGNNVNFYNFAMAHLRTLPGVQSATPQQINPGGTSYVLVHFKGDISQLAAALAARGWIVDIGPARWSRSSPAPTSRPRFRRRRCSLRPPPPAQNTAAVANQAGPTAVKQGPDQIALPLDWPQSEGDARFIVSDANREAFDHFRKFSMWPVKATILTGPRRSGRTLLARSFVERVGGRLFDEADQRDEEELFHAWNQAQDTRPAAGHGRR